MVLQWRGYTLNAHDNESPCHAARLRWRSRGAQPTQRAVEQKSSFQVRSIAERLSAGTAGARGRMGVRVDVWFRKGIEAAAAPAVASRVLFGFAVICGIWHPRRRNSPLWWA